MEASLMHLIRELPPSADDDFRELVSRCEALDDVELAEVVYASNALLRRHTDDAHMQHAPIGRLANIEHAAITACLVRFAPSAFWQALDHLYPI